MGVEFHYPTEAGATTSWVPSKQPQFPYDDPVDNPSQIVIEMASGSIRTQDKGPQIQKYFLKFDRIPKTDRDSYRIFWNTVNKTEKTFEFKDHLGVLHKVRIMNEFKFPLVTNGRHSGDIELRKEV
jgi:hypothetical protein